MATIAPDPRLDGETKVPDIIAALVICCTLSTVAVTLRFVTRLGIMHMTGPDDWLILVAQFLNIGTLIATVFETYNGLGRHIWVVPASHIVPYFKSLYASILLYNGALTLVKISILLQYRRIFAVPSMQKATAIVLAIFIAWGFTLIMMLSMICVPIERLWDKNVNGHCLPLIPAYYSPAAINIATDFGTWVLPLPIIKSLQLPKRQKFILMFIFGLGFFTCITSLIRLSTLKSAAHTADPTYDNVGAAVWSYVELCTATLAACLPTLRPLANRFLPGFLSGHHNKADPNHDSSGYLRHDTGSNKAWVSANGQVVTIGGTGGSKNKKQDDNMQSEALTLVDLEYQLQDLPLSDRAVHANNITVEREVMVDSSIKTP